MIIPGSTIESTINNSNQQQVKKINQKILLNGYNKDMITSLLQVMINMNNFINEYLSLKLKCETTALKFQKFLEILSNSPQLYDSSSLIEAIKNNTPGIINFNVHDVLDKILQEINPFTNNLNNILLSMHVDETFIKKYFELAIQNDEICNCGKLISSTTKTSLIQKLTFDNIDQNKIQNITQAFKKKFYDKTTVKKEKICTFKHSSNQQCTICRDTCSQCQKNIFISENHIITLPEYLIFTIESNAQEKSFSIHYDEEINLKDCSLSTINGITTYELFALVKNEVNDSTFVPTIKQNNQWYTYDNLMKRKLKAFNTYSSIVIALFYQKK